MEEFPGIRTILIPVDFSEAVPALVHYAMELVRGRGAHVVLLHVVGPPVALVDPMQGSLMDPRVLTDLVDRARERLEGIAAGLAGLTVEGKVLVGSPARTIVEEAAATGADVVVVGTHGHSGLKHLLLGSVAEAVVRKAPCPVLVVRHRMVAAKEEAEPGPAAAETPPPRPRTVHAERRAGKPG